METVSFIMLLAVVSLWLNPPKVSHRWKAVYQLAVAIVGAAAIATAIFIAFHASPTK